MILSYFFFLIFTCFLGGIFGIFWESVLFYLSFSVLREYAGGFHATKEIVCLLSTSCSIFICILTISLMEHLNATGLSIGLLLTGSIVVSLLCPMDSEEKPLSAAEKKYYGNKVRKIVVCYVVTAFLSNAIGKYEVTLALVVAVIFEGCLLTLGKLKSR